ncbi:histone-lysine N-methyltransferase 2D [Anoplophora glabripennis]|uniref:histone-lysine N-methyltransferase 2D n=1 Tax=Anoplophora glabripennis TaxID=217634 RepID=UPI000C770962|nr:histone-lysine N-methyltransferase 2D [Anoplophora glabripennis]
MGTQTVTETEFNVLQFEKQLTSLKDSQDSINTCCQWCLQNRTHHKKIVTAWLNVLKRVKVEQRLILFYLANDVVQYSKRRNYEYVESWGTALQKATTMVRDDRVKHKILRIFKIWEQRGVYNEEFISDLCGLLSVVPSGSKSDEPHEFQPNYVIHKIKICAKLDRDTDAKLKVLKEHNPKIQIDDGLIASLKDRAHVDDVEKEIDVYAKHMEDYINALKLEIKNRITLISVLKQAENQLEADRKDVKLVANAYKMFGTRVKTFQKKLEEHKTTLSSPLPSPDINAPSPSPDSDIELPGETEGKVPSAIDVSVSGASDYNPKKELQYSNPGYYNPVTTAGSNSTSSFISNGFSSFIGSDMSFNLENLGSNVFNTNEIQNQSDNMLATINNFSTTSAPVVQDPPLPVEAPTVTTIQTSNYSYTSSHLPLLPPPMPPFSKSEMDYGNNNYNPAYTIAASTSYDNTFTSTSTYETSTAGYNTTQNANLSTFLEESFEPPAGANPYPPSEEYNPEEDLSTWEPDASWNPVQETDTPESPPTFEKEGYRDPVEYHDNLEPSGAVDVDHRVLPGLEGSLGGKDVDHRNLISLTGSPGNSNSNNPADTLWSQTDQDYRITPSGNPQANADQDYRLNFNIEQLKLPPPPPPPPKPLDDSANVVLNHPPNSDFPKHSPSQQSLAKSPRKIDNVESIDMDLSDDDIENKLHQTKQNDNLKVIVDNSVEELQFSLEPPPPLPDLPDDVDANNFLDDLSNELHEFSNLSDELSNSNSAMQDNSMWNQQPLVPPPMMNFGDMISPQLTPMNLPTLNPPMNPPPLNSPMHPPPLNSPMNPPPLNPPMNVPPLNSQMNPLLNPPMNPSMNPMAPMNPPMHPPPNTLMHPPPMPPLLPPPQLTCWNDDDKNLWMEDGPEEEEGNNEMNLDWSQNNWVAPPPNNANFGFRGRGHNRGNPYNSHFNKSPRERGRGRGGYNRGGTFNSGGNMFRGGRGTPRGNRGHRARGNFWGNFRGGF